jgi:hypothetical protein
VTTNHHGALSGNQHAPVRARPRSYTSDQRREEIVVADYELFQEHAPGRRQAKEQKAHHDGDGHDHAAVTKAIQHRRPETLGTAGAHHLQRLAGNAATSSLVAQREAEDPVHSVINSGGGSGLDSKTRESMESRFGHDFSDVKVHQGPQAADAAKSVQAQAFTVGDNIVLGEGKSPSDERTMAHELTHVVQQRTGDVPGSSIGNGLKLSDPGDWAERQAEATADAVVSSGGDHAGHDGGAGAAGGAKASVQTMPEEAQDVQTLPLQRQEEEAPEEEGEQAAQTLPLQREEEAPEEEGSE